MDDERAKAIKDLEDIINIYERHKKQGSITRALVLDTEIVESLKFALESIKAGTGDKFIKYKNVATDLLIAYLESEQAVIGEFSGDFEESALELKKQVLGYLERLDEGEDTFNELVKDMWLFDDYKAD
jgi:hypothetical protein